MAPIASTHAAHLGNSVSEVDPTYGLQNGFVSPHRRRAPSHPASFVPYTAYNTQVDNSNATTPLDVRLIQLRNLLAGTRPQTNPGVPGLTPGAADLTGQTNGDNNFVLMGGIPYFMPNSIADIGDVDINGNDPPVANVGVLRLTPPVAGRWGEAQSVPGYPKLPQPAAVSTWSFQITATRSAPATRRTSATCSTVRPATPPTTI